MATQSSFQAVFQDTAFGSVLRALSGGRILGWTEFEDDNLVEMYLQASGTSLDDYGDDRRIRTESDFILITFTKGDPQNPSNWSSIKKAFVTFQICLLTLSVYIGSAIYTSGLPGIMSDFGVSSVAALLGLSLFVFGYSLGPMLWSPMSETPFLGRTPIYIGTLVVFVALQPAVIYAKNFGMLLAFRFLTGFIGSPSLATGGASIADMYPPERVAYALSLWGVAAAMGPIIGPLVGNFATENKGWTWSLWELTWLCGFCLVLLFFFLPETSSANILFRRSQRLRMVLEKRNANSDGRRISDQAKEHENRQAPNDTTAATRKSLRLKTEGEIEAEAFTGQEAVQMLLVRPFTLMIFEPIVFFINVYIALIYAILYLWFESFPIVFGGIYGFNPGMQGLCFLGILVGIFMTLMCWYAYLYWYFEPLLRASHGKVTPEMRLPPACIGCFFIPISLLIFGWTSRHDVHWIVPIIGTAFFAPGIFLIFQTALVYLGDAYPKHIASVYAGNDLVRSSFGGAFPLFANAMFQKLGINWGNTLLALLSVLFIPIPFLLLRFGRSIRMRSKNATHD